MKLHKIILALDSFKGSLPSLQAADACEQGIRKVFPICEIVKLPIADGGEGTLDALVSATSGRYNTCRVHDPLMRPIQAKYGISGDGKTAFVELAQASGLTLLLPNERNPMKTTTYGTGELIRSAIVQGHRNFLIGIGGSATNDAGTGLLQALGFRFFDADGNTLHGCGENLHKIAKIDTQTVIPELQECRFRVACDVTNPFAGPMGAAFVYAPQKGATPAMICQLDNGLQHFASLVKQTCKFDLDAMQGAGAAGGVGGAMAAFLHADLESGIRLLADVLHIVGHAPNADLIITGEGKIDPQSFMGKTLQGITEIGRTANVPVIAIAGQTNCLDEPHKHGIAGIYATTPPDMPIGQALQSDVAMRNIADTVRQIMERIRANGLPATG